MDLILYAVPFFLVLIAVELLADRWRGMSNYRIADAINSISTGVLSTTTGLLTKGVGLLTYACALKHLALFELSADSVWVWVFAFVLYDFCYYWLHRWAMNATSSGPRIRCITRARTTTSPRLCAKPAPASC